MIGQFVITSFEAGGGKLDSSISAPGYFLMDVVIHHLYAVAFSSIHTPSWQVVAAGRGYVQTLCWECRFQVRFFF